MMTFRWKVERQLIEHRGYRAANDLIQLTYRPIGLA